MNFGLLHSHFPTPRGDVFTVAGLGAPSLLEHGNLHFAAVVQRAGPLASGHSTRVSEDAGPMARTHSTMLPLGTVAPNFSLPDVVTGRTVARADFQNATALLVMFLCNHCPYVKHVQAGLAQMARDFQALGVGVVAISSNDVANYPDDSPEKMQEEAARAGYTFPYLFDETQSVARAYRAACTPDFFLFDRQHRLVYRGQMDEARRANSVPVTGSSLREAVAALLEGRPVSSQQIPSLGCNIKWKPGNEPDYFQILS